MPKIYRVMYESNSKPEVGTDRNKLGARLGIDVKPDAEGNIRPAGKGMSVNICPCQIPGVILPARLNDIGIKRGAIGNDALKVWSMGSGGFVAGPIAAKLELLPDAKVIPAYHGVVQPDSVISLDGYQDALADTKDAWLVNEQRNTNCPFCQ